MSSLRVHSTLPFVLALSFFGCFSVLGCGVGQVDDPVENEEIHVDDVDPVDIPDVGPPEDTAADADAGDTDVEPEPDPDEPIACDDPIPEPPPGERCSVQPGTSDHLLLRGTVLAGDDVYEEGTVLIDDQAPNRRIECVGCDCGEEPAAQDATVVACPDGVISPGLINPHDHLTFAEGRPQPHGDERFDHRHDWRRGLRGHTQISTWPRTGGHREVVLYGELRMLLGGSTSIAGSTGFTNATGLLRNLDQPFDTEGLDGINVNYQTFPLGDGGFPALISDGCGYPGIDGEEELEDGIYLPHVAEGVDAEAHNELACLAGESGTNLIRENTSIIHGVAVSARDVAIIADRGANLVWSPRTNIDLYGNTAPVPLYQRFGVPISLGTDWSTSGSMNMLRELECADYLNRMHYNETFTEADLWKMATYNAAISMGAEHKLGLLDTDYVADITIFDDRGRTPYRAVIDADVDDIALVMRGGQPLYGDAGAIEALVDAQSLDKCEAIDVCERSRRACIELDTGHSLDEIKSEIHPESYPLFFCDVPDDEPTCVPSRPSEYDGITTPSDSSGDGIADVMDNCPDYFNPIRPMDDGLQADTSGNGIGDVCDPCPLSQDPDCEEIDPNDWSGDGVPNDEDNCPFHYNPEQGDTSDDGIGDVCSPCPEHHITDGSPCPATIYDVKTGEVTDGQRLEIKDALVTAALPEEGLFLQVHPEDEHYDGVEHSGLYVFLRNASVLEEVGFPQAGDRIRVVGTVSDFFNQLQVARVTDLEILSSGHSLPEPVVATPADVATGGDRQTELEGTLVEVQDVVVTDIDVPPGPGDSAPTDEFIVDDSLHINNFFYLVTPFPDLDDSFNSIAGVLRWANDNSKLEPRFEDDVELGPPDLSALVPDLAFVEVSDTPEPVLELLLDHAPQDDVTVDLSYSDSGVIEGPDSVVVDAGEESKTIELRGLEARDEPVLVEATHEELTVSAEVRTYDSETERVLQSLDAPQKAVFAGDILRLTATLNVPADTAGETVSLEIAPDSDADFPSEITLGAGERSATVDVELDDTIGRFVAFATHGDITETFGFETFEESQTFVETFTNFDTPGSQYVDGAFDGDVGFAWSYLEARATTGDSGSSAPAIDGTSMILRDTTSSVGADDIAGGISSFSIELKQAFTGSGDRQIEVFIDGESRGTSTAFEGGGEVHEFSLDELATYGDFDLEIQPTTDNQITIDNLSWTSGFPVDPESIEFSTATLDRFSPQELTLEVSEEPIAALTLELADPALEETTVALSYADEDAIDGPSEVTFLSGETSVEIALQALQIRENPVEVEATLGADTVTADVHPVGPPDVDSFAPEFAFLEVSSEFEPVLEIFLERPPQSPRTVELDYAPDDAIEGPDSVVVAGGETSQTIELRALDGRVDPVTVTATADESTAVAEIRTYDDESERNLISLEGHQDAAFPQETLIFSAAIDLPAGSEGETIAFSIAPDSDATYPAEVTIPAGDRQADVEVQWGDDTGVFVAVADQTMTHPFEIFPPPETTVETFANLDAPSGTYDDGTYVGDAGHEWSYADGRRAPVSGAPAIDDTSLIFADSGERYLRATAIPGGISSFSIDMKQAFSGDGSRQLELLINGESIDTSTPFGFEGDDEGEVFEFAVDDIDVHGDFDLEIRSIGDRQITVDNLTWTSAFPTAPEDLEFAALELAEFTPQLAFVEVGTGTSPVLSVQSVHPALETRDVALSYADSDAIGGPDTITFGPGDTAVEVSVEAFQARPEPVEVSATFDGDEILAGVHPFDDDTPRNITAMNACPTALFDATVPFSVELDVPAGESGLELPIDVDPQEHVADPPDPLTLVEGERSAEFFLTFDQQDGPVDVTLSTDDDNATVDIDVIDLSGAEPPLVEDFSNFTSSGSGYDTGDFAGNYDLLWHYSQAQNTEEWAIDDNSMILRDGDEYDAWLRIDEIPGGIASFSVDMKRAFTNDNDRQLELSINGQPVATSEVFGEDDQVRTFEVDNLDIDCVESLKLESIGDAQISIDNLTWVPTDP